MAISVIPDADDAQAWEQTVNALNRLTVATARTIRILHRLGWKDSAIAERFGVNEHEARLLWHTKETV